MTVSTNHPEVLERLTAGIAELTTSNAWQNWLDTSRRFHHYSFHNQLLIALQRPDATRVAGFQTWRTLNRCVRKGEKGLVILAPVTRRTRVDSDESDEQLLAKRVVGFRTAHVFDISQTDGEPLPEPPCQRLDGDDATSAYMQLVEVAHSIGYTVEQEQLFGARNGDCTFSEKRIRIEATNSSVQQCKTLAHELAHALLHENATISREIAELDAESVAYVVMATLGVDSGAYSFGYCASWAGGGDEAVQVITASGQRIVSAARTIIETLPVPGAVAEVAA